MIYKKRKGMLVRIITADGQHLVGRYIRSERVVGEWTPVFRVGRHNKLFRGYEGWWLPLAIAEKAEAVAGTTSSSA